MQAFLGDWTNLLLRWAHLVVGIGWIGTSFYFIALDYSLRARTRMNEGVRGTAWQVHGGGFYHIEKYTVAPRELPPDLHWFRWEAYLTFMTGFGLLAVQYYWHAEIYLIDSTVLALLPWQATVLSGVSLAASWYVYDALCRSPVGRRPVTLAFCIFALIAAAAWFYGQVFSARGAFVHVGALTGTIMAVNVFAVIIPNQKTMIAQMMRGETPDARLGFIGKQRSLHNNYLTLPVLLMMVSPHYPFLSAHPQNWLVVALIFIAGGSIRHIFNRAEAGDEWNSFVWAAPLAAIVLLGAIYVTAPRQASGNGTVTEAAAFGIVQKHCVMCHAMAPAHVAFSEPPKNVTLESPAEMKRFAGPILEQAVQSRAMPLGNQTGMTDAEREMLGRWVAGLK